MDPTTAVHVRHAPCWILDLYHEKSIWDICQLILFCKARYNTPASFIIMVGSLVEDELHVPHLVSTTKLTAAYRRSMYKRTGTTTTAWPNKASNT